MAAAAASESTQAAEQRENRPPIYVPSRRDEGQRRVGLRDSLNGGEMPLRQDSGYQPKTQFSYVPSAEVAREQKQNSIFGRQNSRGSSGTRYQPSQMSGAATTS